MAPGGSSIKITSSSWQDVGDYVRQIKPTARMDAVAPGDNPEPVEGGHDLTGGLCFSPFVHAMQM